MTLSAEPLAIAARLAESAGLPPPLRAEPLPGGRNNRVFRVGLSDGRSAALKIYFRHPDDTRDRLGAEWDFLEHARRRAPGWTAPPLAREEATGAALHGFVEGARFSPGQVDGTAVEFGRKIHPGRGLSRRRKGVARRIRSLLLRRGACRRD